MDFTTKHRTWDEIRSIVEDFRNLHVKPPDELPVDMEKIIEHELRIDFDLRPNLLSDADIDAFLSPDGKTMFVDQNQYMDERYSNRLRFTFAHEIGHFILHIEEIQLLNFKNIEDWIDFQTQFPDENRRWFERQADEFAGRLLVPKNILTKEIQKYEEKINEYLKLSNNDNLDFLARHVGSKICSIFGVSETVLYHRICKEKIFEELNYIP